jgi:MYXO-CTERM domain-containing protein
MGTTTFTATAFDANNNVVNAAVTWSASSTAGLVTAGGVFTAGTMSGTYNAAVTATVGSVSGTANVTINAGALSQLVVTPAVASTQAGGTVAFSASGRDGNGNTVTVTPVWSVVSGGGTISPMGVFTAGTTTGTFANTVRAESNGVTAFATVSVTAGPLVRITLTPAMADLLEGTSQQFSGTGADAFGNAVPATLTWSANAMAGTINSSGLFTAGTLAGDYPTGVTATSGTVSATASIRVRSLVAMDAGVDAGVVDAGVDAGVDDAGTMMSDAGQMMESDGGMLIPLPDAGMPGDTHGVTTCGCQSVDAMFGALGLLALALRRRRRT